MRPTERFICLSLLLSCAIYTSTALAGENSCNRRQFEQCVKAMIMLDDPAFVYPTTLPEVNSLCRNFKRNHACALAYTQKCLKGETKNSVALIFYGFAKAQRVNCSNNKRKQTQLTLGRCANAHRRDITQGIAQMNRQFHGIKVYPNAKERIPMICCTFFNYKQTLLRSLTKDCTPREISGIEVLIDGLAADGVSFACGDYEDNDRCAPLLRKIPDWKKPFDTPIFFLTIVDILKGL